MPPPNLNIKDLNHLLGNIDIYLLDQILKGRFSPTDKILDAGCGEGRNLIYFIRHNYPVFAIDKNEDSVRMLRHLAKSINQQFPVEQFIIGNVNQLPYGDNEFNAVISSAVLHFAENERQFRQQFAELMRVLKPGGILFLRMATLISIEEAAKPLEDGKYYLPDGSVRFLLTRELLQEIENQATLIEPFKAVLVDGKRCMCTLVLKKPD